MMLSQNSNWQNINIRKLVFVCLIAILLVVVGYILLQQLNKGRLHITTENGATIYVAREQEGEFEEVGTSETTYTSSSEGPVYIKVEKGEKITHTSAQLMRRSSDDVTVQLTDTSQSQEIAPGPLSFIYKDANFIYGLNPDTKSITYYPLGEQKFADVSYIQLPFVSKVAWYDSKNLIYNSFLEGVGYFVNGKKQVPSFGPEGGLLRFNNFAKLASGEIALVDATNVYVVSSVNDTELKTAYQHSTGNINIFAVDDSFVFANLVYEEVQSEGSDPDPDHTEVALINKDGTTTKSAQIDLLSPVESVVRLSDQRLLMLSNSSLVSLDVGGGVIEQNNPLYYREASDLVSYKNSIYVLNKGGLWRYDIPNKALNLVSSYPKNEEYVSGSLESLNGSLLYSTQITESAISNFETGASSRIYEVKL